MSEIDKKLLRLLVSIYDNNDFIVGIFSNADNVEDRQTIIEYIEKDDDVSVENIILLSVFLDNKRNNPERNLKSDFWLVITRKNKRVFLLKEVMKEKSIPKIMNDIIAILNNSVYSMEQRKIILDMVKSYIDINLMDMGIDDIPFSAD